MSLLASRLATAIQAKMIAKGTGAVPGPALTGMCEAIAEAVVDELNTHGEVDPTTGIPPMTTGTGPVAGRGRIL